MEPAGPPARYLTLRDYLQVVRRYRVAIVAVAIFGAVAGLVDAERQSPTYRATALVTFQDPAEATTLVGLSPGLVQPPAALAAENAETVTRPGVMTVVQRRLGTKQSPQSLAGAVSAEVSNAGLLHVSASSTDPAFAARLANTVASVLISQDNAQTRAIFARAASVIQGQIASLRAANSPGSTARLLEYEQELGRLGTLSKFVQSAQIGEPASQPVSSSPSALRSTLIGLALGLLLAIVLAFVRDTLDRRLRAAQDVESSFEFPILGHVRNQAMGRIAYLPTTGGTSKNADLEAFRILRRNLEFLNLESPPRSVIVTSAVAEEGKSTVAGSLAFALAAAGKRTLLVDCDLRRAALADRLGIPSRPGMSDYLAGDAAPQQIVQQIRFAAPASSNGTRAFEDGVSGTRANTLVAIPAGSPTSHTAELLGSPRFREFLDQVREIYDAIVIDSSPLLPVADTLEMLPHADAVVICARESKTTREEALAARAAVARFPELSVGVVITGVKTNHSEYAVYAHAYS